MLSTLEIHRRVITIDWLVIILIIEYCIFTNVDLKLINAKNRLLKNISLGVLVKFIFPLLSIFLVNYISHHYLYTPLNNLWLILVDLLVLDLVLYFFHVLAYKNIILSQLEIWVKIC